jgi:hypothetical protein
MVRLTTLAPKQGSVIWDRYDSIHSPAHKGRGNGPSHSGEVSIAGRERLICGTSQQALLSRGAGHD